MFHLNVYGLHAGWRGVPSMALFDREEGGFEGVSGRWNDSISARRMNCNGVRGDPPVEGVFRDRGLWPLGVDRAKEGRNGAPGSGVRGGGGRGGGDMLLPDARRLTELIHFSSRVPRLGESVGSKGHNSAK